MITQFFVELEELPLTPNGKIDYQALVRPELKPPELESSFVAPRNEIEKNLVTIWAEVLGFSDIGIHDNFFKLGGHSLLATRVIARLHDVFEVELPVRALFEAPTVRELAERIHWIAQGTGALTTEDSTTQEQLEGTI